MSSLLKVLVVDDEPIAREGMTRLVQQDPELSVCAECEDGSSAVEAIRTLAPDLILLDVQMPGVDGFGVIREIGVANMPAVVFVTAFDAHAIHAFDVHAVDYVLKPFADERLHQALAHAKELVRQRTLRSLSGQLLGVLAALPEHTVATSATPTHEGQWIRRLPVRHEGSLIYINAAEIEWIEGADYYARVHARKRTFLVRESLAALGERLDPARFFRTHRSAIINLDHVREMQPMFRGEAVAILHGGARVRIARPRRAALEHALEGGGGKARS